MKSLERIAGLKTWLAESQITPGLEVVGCAQHLAVAAEIAERSITLVRDDSHLLPLTLQPDQLITVIIPRPADLTPADTSSYLLPGLAQAIGRYHPRVQEIIVPFAPDSKDIADVLSRAAGSAMIVIGTLNAFDCPQQADLVNGLLQRGIPTVVAAMRLPYDLTVFPTAPVFLCTYSIQQPSMDALARVLFDKITPQGRLPVSIPDLYPAGHRLSTLSG